MMMAANPTAAANAAAPALRVQDLRIDLPPGADRPHAVQNASFEVMPGEVVCLLGESGSGKSVIARAVMGLLPEGLHVSGGSITLCGEDLLAASPDRLRYIPVVTREPFPGALPARIPKLIEDGRLEQAARIELDPQRSRIMVCGNPEMSRELRGQLTERGFRANRRAVPGHLAFENYWNGTPPRLLP